MDLQHVNIKIHTDGALAVDPARFIEVFHDWVREGELPGLLIDVADYRHVPEGPGVMLIGLEADYSMDQLDAQWGLRYNRKNPLEGDNATRFTDALWSASNACHKLETIFAGDGLKFSRQTFELFINDRLLAPNAPDTYTACTPEIEQFLQSALGHNAFELQDHAGDPRRRFGFTVQCRPPYDLARLVETLGS